MQRGIGLEFFPQIAIEGGKRMGRGEVLFKEHPHRIPFIAKAGLNRDQDIAKLHAQDE